MTTLLPSPSAPGCMITSAPPKAKPSLCLASPVPVTNTLSLWGDRSPAIGNGAPSSSKWVQTVSNQTFWRSRKPGAKAFFPEPALSGPV